MRRLVAFFYIISLCTPSKAQTPGMVEWVTPPLATNKPQTDAEAAAGRASGRKLPSPEAIQPTLDPALAPYTPHADRKISGSFKAASSDVLPGLAAKWIAAFRKFY